MKYSLKQASAIGIGHLRFFRFGAAALLLCIFTTLSSQATSEQIEVNSADLPPFSYKLNELQTGIAADMLMAAASKARVSLHFEYLPWARAQFDTQNSRNKLIIPLTRIPERESSYRWLVELFQYQFILVSKNREAAIDLEQAKKFKIGVLRNNAAIPFLEKSGFTDIDLAPTEEINARKLNAGRIDYWVVADLAVHYIYRNAGFNPAELKFGLKLGEPQTIYLSGSKELDDPKIDLLQESLKQMKANGQLDDIVRQYKCQSDTANVASSNNRIQCKKMPHKRTL